MGPARGWSGDSGGRRALHVHARVLGAGPQVPDRLPVRRLEHYRPSADDRVQLDPHSLVECLVGSSFCTRSSLAKLVVPLLAAASPSRLPFKNMRMIVTAGWSIYPLGYLF